MDKDKRIKELEEMAKVSLTGEEISNLLEVLSPNFKKEYDKLMGF